MKQILKIICIASVLIACKNVDPNEQIDEGEVKNGTFSSEEIGWTMKIPDDWKVTTRDETESSNARGLELLEETADMEIDPVGMKNLIGFRKNSFNIFQSTSQPFEVEYPGEWNESNIMLKSLVNQAFADQGIRTDTTATTLVKIDGLDFQTYETTLYGKKGEIILKQLMYSRLINGFDFGVSISYNNEADRKTMVDALMNSTFEIREEQKSLTK